MVQAQVERREILGVKGMSIMMALEDFDVVWSNGLDYMHNCCLGVMKFLFSLWFSPKFRAETFYIGYSIDRLSKSLKSIKTPKRNSRKPGNLQDYNTWKASQFRDFILHFGVVVLKSVLLTEYFEHFKLFTDAIFMLSKNCIEYSDFKTASEKIFK